ncbi:MAG TPA: helix-turn-helix transcriptional regulator [Bacilli bacterium]
MTIDKIVKSIRALLRITQEELAHHLNISFSTINRWENGHTVPSKLAKMKLIEYCIQKEVENEVIIELQKL